jgi:hypothetical protein
MTKRYIPGMAKYSIRSIEVPFQTQMRMALEYLRRGIVRPALHDRVAGDLVSWSRWPLALCTRSTERRSLIDDRLLVHHHPLRPDLHFGLHLLWCRSIIVCLTVDAGAKYRAMYRFIGLPLVIG